MLEEKLKTKLKLSKKGKVEKAGEAARKKSGKKKHATEDVDAVAASIDAAVKKSKPWKLDCTASVSVGAKQGYVNDLTWAGNSALAAGLSTGVVNLYEAQPAEFRLVHSNNAHRGPAKQLRFSPDSPQLLYSCGGDGAVVGWDYRASRAAHRMVAEGAFLNTFDTSDHLVAAGANGSVLFWDVRRATSTGEAAVLANFEDTHEQEVTRVAFHREAQKFLSASEDGLVAVFDFTVAMDEDESFQGAVNLMDSVADFGFFGSRRDLLWCRTFTESFYLWEWAAACEEDSQGGAGPLATVRDAREQLSAAAKKRLPKGVDYLVSCTYSADSDRLTLSAGSADGSVATFPVSLAEGSCGFGKPTAVLRGIHTAVVRSQVWPESDAFYTFTGCEDGKIAAWKAPALR